MRIVVIGAGVVGVTTAYVLARDGHAVTVIEREPSTAMESSFANGGQLSFGFAAPMASAGLLVKAPGILLGRDRAFRLPPAFVARHLGWVTRFAHACLPGPGKRYGRDLLAMASRSRSALDRLCRETGVHFERRRTGKLILHR
ncbi:MAG: FAD-dependent oxidoreductase, partial [Pseudomonadota bacterium]